MTPHQKEPLPFDPEGFPALQDLFGGYFHEDFTEEYGSAAEAAQAFLSDASSDEIANVKDEWLGLREALAGRPLPAIQAALHRLGSAWQPSNLSEWDSLHKILSQAQA